MKKKYIIALEDRNVWSCGFPAKTLLLSDVSIFGTDLASVNTGIELTPYTEPGLEQVRKEAYEQGWKEAEDHYDDGYSDGYDVGLDDAWKAARKIHRMSDGDILDLFPDCYASVCTAAQAILKYDASEAIAKIKEYEDGKQEIKVGDEVVGVFSDGSKTRPFVFIRGSQEYYFGLYSDTGEFCQGGMNMRKTGRHFPEIAAVLEKMRGEQE